MSLGTWKDMIWPLPSGRICSGRRTLPGPRSLFDPHSCRTAGLIRVANSAERRLTLQTYNLFRRQNEEDLYCAVPEDVPVPPFVTDERWEWAQSLDVSQLSGFDAKAAEISANRNGFYLFHSTDTQGGSGKADHAGEG